ncbi:MAG: shikimate kinase AroK, partial [Xanthomonadaceae bacterium]|nr:shikimate kinase AroK [Xanthomonadaceae bacterium]
MNPSRNLFLIGPTGAGKTSAGRRLAAHYGLRFVDLDREIERRTGTSVGTVFELEGEAGFRQRESALLDECSAAD